jgi:hypothetical protein
VRGITLALRGMLFNITTELSFFHVRSAGVYPVDEGHDGPNNLKNLMDYPSAQSSILCRSVRNLQALHSSSHFFGLSKIKSPVSTLCQQKTALSVISRENGRELMSELDVQ